MKRKTLYLISNAHLDPVWQWEWEEGAAAERRAQDGYNTALGHATDKIRGAAAVSRMPWGEVRTLYLTKEGVKPAPSMLDL